MKLYEICDKLNNFEIKCDEDGVVLNADELDQLEMEKTEKIKNIGLLVKNLNADLTELTEEKKNMVSRFDARIKAIERDIDFYKEYLTKYLDGDKFESDDKTVVISYRPSQKAIVDDITLVSPEYLKEQEPKADLTAIKKAINSGIIVDGCHIEDCNNIQIK